jgi:hypothetical protein
MAKAAVKIAVITQKVKALLQPSGLRLVNVTKNGKCRIEVPGTEQTPKRSKWMQYESLIAQIAAGTSVSRIFNHPADSTRKTTPNSTYRSARKSPKPVATSTPMAAFMAGHRASVPVTPAFESAGQPHW